MDPRDVSPESEEEVAAFAEEDDAVEKASLKRSFHFVVGTQCQQFGKED